MMILDRLVMSEIRRNCAWHTDHFTFKVDFRFTNKGSNDTGSNNKGSNDTGSNDTGSNDKGSKARQRVKRHRVKKSDIGANYL